MTYKFAFACLLAAAAPAFADELPVPPLPPGQTPADLAAPIPDNDLRNPLVASSDSPSVALKFYRARPYEPGLGFAPGSRYQTNEDRKPIQTPGLSVSVPLK